MSQTVEQSKPEKGWSPRTLRLALLASLAVNLLGVGIVGGAMLAPPAQHPRGEFGLRSFSYTLPEARGQMMRSDFQAHKPAVTELRQTARAARNEAIEVLAAEPYDQEKLSSALARLNDAEAKARQRVSEFFLMIAGKLTPQERSALSQWWREHQAARHRRHGHDKTGDAGTSEPVGKGTESPQAGQ